MLKGFYIVNILFWFWRTRIYALIGMIAWLNFKNIFSKWGIKLRNKIITLSAFVPSQIEFGLLREKRNHFNVDIAEMILNMKEEKNWDRELIRSVSITFAWTKTNVNSLSPFFVMSYATLSYQLSISLHW